MEEVDECICRRQEQSPSNPVQHVEVQQKKWCFRVDIEFFDVDKAGTRENVSGSCPRNP